MVPREAKKEMLPLVPQLSNEITVMVSFYSPSTLLLSRFFVLVKCGSGFQLVTFLITLAHVSEFLHLVKRSAFCPFSDSARGLSDAASTSLSEQTGTQC